MKIEKEVIYNIVTKEGARIEVSEQELVELYKELGKLVISSTKFAPSTEMDKKFFVDQGEY